MHVFAVVIALAVAFLIGSFPTALMLGRLRGIDIRRHGSGNIGATNVFRVMGRGWGFLCLAIDVFKGWLPVWLTDLTFKLFAIPWLTSDAWLWIAGLTAIAGHMFTPFLRFRGGKGVATSIGVFLAIAPLPLLICVVVGLLVIWLTGWVSLASIVCSAMLPPLILLVSLFRQLPVPWTSIGVTLMLAAVIAFKHRSNIRRLRDGTEPRLFDKLNAMMNEGGPEAEVVPRDDEAPL